MSTSNNKKMKVPQFRNKGHLMSKLRKTLSSNQMENLEKEQVARKRCC